MRVRLPNLLAALDDRALLSRFAHDRDQPAFEQLVKRHGALVFGVCRRLLRDPHAAEDAFQAVFLVLARDPWRAADASSVGGWLFGVARRVGLAAQRHERRRARREARCQSHQGANEPLPPRGGNLPRSPGEADELLAALDEELAALPDDLRAGLVACFLEERTHDEAARELGWSVSTLRRRLDRGKELLRSRLARRGVSLAVGLLATALAARSAPALASPSPVVAALATEVLSRGGASKVLAALAGIALVFGSAAYGLTRAPAGEPEPPKMFAPPVIAAPVVPKPWANVSGRVVFDRELDLPGPWLVPPGLVKDADVWRPFGPLAYDVTAVDPDTRGIADTIVFLRPDSDDWKAPFPAARVHPDLASPKPLDRRVTAAGPHFAPRTIAARAGDRLVFDNRLPVAVTVARYTANGPPVKSNVMLARGDTYTTESLTAAHRADRFVNHVHPWMDGFVWAFDHPYFAVTNARGRFELPNVPVGTWRLVAWHRALGQREAKVVAADDCNIPPIVFTTVR